MANQTGSEPATYVAWNPCGCIGGLCVDSPEHKRDTAKFVADMIRHGCTVELKSTEWVRTECPIAACVDNPACARAPKVRRRKPRQEVVL